MGSYCHREEGPRPEYRPSTKIGGTRHIAATFDHFWIKAKGGRPTSIGEHLLGEIEEKQEISEETNPIDKEVNPSATEAKEKNEKKLKELKTGHSEEAHRETAEYL